MSIPCRLMLFRGPLDRTGFALGVAASSRVINGNRRPRKPAEGEASFITDPPGTGNDTEVVLHQYATSLARRIVGQRRKHMMESVIASRRGGWRSPRLARRMSLSGVYYRIDARRGYGTNQRVPPGHPPSTKVRRTTSNSVLNSGPSTSDSSSLEVPTDFRLLFSNIVATRNRLRESRPHSVLNEQSESYRHLGRLPTR